MRSPEHRILGNYPGSIQVFNSNPKAGDRTSKAPGGHHGRGLFLQKGKIRSQVPATTPDKHAKDGLKAIPTAFRRKPCALFGVLHQQLEVSAWDRNELMVYWT
jgi:hypothetical protein